MKKSFLFLGRFLITLAVVFIAAVVAFRLWSYYTLAPWTRDGHIRADVVQIAPDVSGMVTKVLVRDNEKIHQGQTLFIVDHERFELALKQAQANVAAQQAALAQARRESARNKQLENLVAKETTEESFSKVQQGEALLSRLQAEEGVARLNLQRATITSPVDGYMNDHAPRVGDYVLTGKPVLSIVDAASFHVEGYFEETKVQRIAINQPVEIHIMGESQPLHGHVQSIAAGIEDRDRVGGTSLLPNINPTFNWVRLPQRIPVRITLDDVPEDVRLIAGRTATVSVDTGMSSAMNMLRWWPL